MGLIDTFEQREIQTEKNIALKTDVQQEKRLAAIVDQFTNYWEVYVDDQRSEHNPRSRNYDFDAFGVQKNDIQPLVDCLHTFSPERIVPMNRVLDNGVGEFYSCATTLITRMIQYCYNQGENDFRVHLPVLSGSNGQSASHFGQFLSGTRSNSLRIRISSEGDLHSAGSHGEYLGMSFLSPTASMCGVNSRDSNFEFLAPAGASTAFQAVRSHFIFRGPVEKALGQHARDCAFWCYDTVGGTPPFHLSNNCTIYATDINVLARSKEWVLGNLLIDYGDRVVRAINGENYSIALRKIEQSDEPHYKR